MCFDVGAARRVGVSPVSIHHALLGDQLPSFLRFSLFTLLLFSCGSLAAPPFSDAVMRDYLKNDRAGLAQRNAPVFFFGQKDRQPPCIPTWAYRGTPDSPDNYTRDHRTEPAKRCLYEDVGCDCRRPEIDIVNRAPAFPIYFTIRECSASEIRIVLSLFYEKDGAICVVPLRHGYYFDVGHNFDWERVVVVYRRDQVDGQWRADRLLMSQHGGYLNKAWSTIRQTLSSQQALLPDPRHIIGRRGQNHPVVYVGWLKHPHFDSKNTFPWGWLVQLTNKAFRSDDWWLLVDRENLIEASDSTDAGRIMRLQDWGHASSIPPTTDQGICGESLRDGFIATNDTDTPEGLDDLVNRTSALPNGTLIASSNGGLKYIVTRLA